jgi:putative endonuclease
MTYAFYLMNNKPRGLLYHGSTASLPRRKDQHAGKLFGGSAYCKKYGLTRLVYFEVFDSKGEALKREWQVKRWRREWKIKLIETTNPEWRDLSSELIHLLPWDLMKD